LKVALAVSDRMANPDESRSSSELSPPLERPGTYRMIIPTENDPGPGLGENLVCHQRHQFARPRTAGDEWRLIYT
jgi:hypothetical protein